MVLTQKKCAVILSEFNRALYFDPNADCIQYARRLADLFRKMERECEGRVVSTLFLNLYGLDAFMLRGDLCRLETHGAAKPTPRQRTELLSVLYGTLSLYTGGDFSSIFAARDRGAQAGQETYETILSEFKEEVCRKLPADHFVPPPSSSSDHLIPHIQKLMLAAKVRKMEKECEERVVGTLLLNLYGQDVPLLERDITKVTMFGTANVDPSELLPILYGALSSHMGEDFSDVMEMCDKIEEMEQ